MDVVTRLRNPEYTGPRRCLPCTVVNVALLSVAAALLAAAGYLAVAGAGFVLGLAIIALRGYLVPFTPRFAPRVVDALPVPSEWFHTERTDGSLSGDADLSGEAVLEALIRAGVVHAEGERLVLDGAFERRWREEMQRLADPSELEAGVESMPGVSGANLTASTGKEWIAIDGRTSLVPRPVAVAELGAYRALQSDLEDRVALGAVSALRQFLEECPVCETPLERSTVVACCGGYTTPRDTPDETLVCPECDHRLLRIPRSDEDSQ